MKRPEEIMAEMQRHLLDCASASDRERAAERRAFWDRMASTIQPEWAQIEKAGGVEVMDLALDRLTRKCLLRDWFERDSQQFKRFADRARSIATEVYSLSMESNVVAGSALGAKDESLRSRGADLMLAGSELVVAMGRFTDLAAALLENLPDQGGGRGILSRQIDGGPHEPFRAFALVARDTWRESGLTVGGNGSVDQGFSAFLDAVHADLFGTKIAGRPALLARLRKA